MGYEPTMSISHFRIHSFARELILGLLWCLERFAARVYGPIVSPTIAVSDNPGSSHLNAIFQYLCAFSILTPGLARQLPKNEDGVIQMPVIVAIHNVHKFSYHQLTALKMGFQAMYNLCVNVLKLKFYKNFNV